MKPTLKIHRLAQPTSPGTVQRHERSIQRQAVQFPIRQILHAKRRAPARRSIEHIHRLIDLAWNVDANAKELRLHLLETVPSPETVLGRLPPDAYLKPPLLSRLSSLRYIRLRIAY